MYKGTEARSRAFRRRLSQEFFPGSRIQDLVARGELSEEVARRIDSRPGPAVHALIAAHRRMDANRFSALPDTIGLIGGQVARDYLLGLLDKVRGSKTDSVVLNALNHVQTRTPRDANRLFAVLHDARYTSYGRATAYEGILDRIPERRREGYARRLLSSLARAELRDNPIIWEVVLRWREDLEHRLPRHKSRIDALFESC